MEPITRRNLVKYLGIGSAAIGAAVATGPIGAGVAGYAVGSRKKEVEDAVREINEFGPNTLALHNTYGVIEKTQTPRGYLTVNSWNGKKVVPGTEKQVTVPMAPGPDGHLYLKINGDWRRIVTE